MRRRYSEVFLPWIVASGLVMLLPAARAGFCPTAIADANMMPAQGAIPGSFFTGDPVIPPPVWPTRPVPAPAPAAMPVEGADQDLCGPAVASASTSQNLPAGLLNAIAIVESGRLNPQTGNLKPWPWTIDANGAGYRYPTEQAAEQAASGFEAAGITSLDIGCLQVNLAQHPDAFANLAQAFDPATNANYAARFLTSLEQKFGNWPQAVAAYHSQTPTLGAPYQARVYAQLQGAAPMTLAAAFIPSPGQPQGQMAAMSPPMPIPPPTAFAMSSLMPPAQTILRQDRGFTGRSLASYRAAPVAIDRMPAPPILAPQG